MKRKLTSIVMVWLLSGLVSCSPKDDIGKIKVGDENKFEIISIEEMKSNNGYISIIEYKETGKRFILYQGYNGRSGLCPLD